MAHTTTSARDDSWLTVFKAAVAAFILLPGLYAFGLGFGGEMMWTGVMIVAELGIVAVGLMAIYFAQHGTSS